MKLALKALFGGIFAAMIWVTVRASLQRSLLDAPIEFTDAPWAVATLYDAYFGFLTFYCWVVYKESSWIGRSVWFILIMCLGNLAMSAYVLRELFRLKDEEPASAVLWRRAG